MRATASSYSEKEDAGSQKVTLTESFAAIILVTCNDIDTMMVHIVFLITYKAIEPMAS